ncbi:hypothetical protein MN608_03818 [Microdochium nivale]|nr:hypothetical protein MN608_03818 [Microdochium nivale]
MLAPPSGFRKRRELHPNSAHLFENTQVRCQFCGVSFGVGRIRTAQEPRGAAWSNGGGWTSERRGYVVGGHKPQYEDCLRPRGDTTPPPPPKEEREARAAYWKKMAEGAGCRLVRHEQPLWVTSRDRRLRSAGAAPLSNKEWESVDEDESSSFEPGHDSGDDDPFEYASEPGSAEIDAYESNLEGGDAVSTASQDELGRAFSVEGRSPLEVMDSEFEPLSACWDAESYSGEDSQEEEDEGNQDFDDMRYRFYEHIAGPDCAHNQGYNGHRISVDEMLHGHTAQFLARKRMLEDSGAAWEPAEDDLDFERDSDCFLTGLSRAAPVTDDSIRVLPERHGIDVIESDNFLYDWMNLDEYGLPFHPTCFELYCQASRAAFNGRVEVDGLMELRDTTCREPGEWPVTATWPAKWNKDAQRSYWQGWSCLNGCEYLVANPVYVPRLSAIVALSTAAAGQESGFSIQDSPFPYREPAVPLIAGGDPFLRLPVEVNHYVVDYLGSKDIANLRLASHAFQQLPVSLWHRLVLEEMPFLYEAWSNDVQPYPWASRLALDWDEYAKAKESSTAYRMRRRRVIMEDAPEASEEWIENEVVLDDAEIESQTMCADRKRILGYAPVKLQLERTDWYRLYRDIVVDWEHLMGLRNRERIWQYVVDITQAVGQMMPTQDTDTEMST